ncbi:hypothetical protein ZWY2020_058272 [Hordeum vulgare]|nr:hypothetical protein ZWY2020_058272 [Hordeum vulgare]
MPSPWHTFCSTDAAVGRRQRPLLLLSSLMDVSAGLRPAGGGTETSEAEQWGWWIGHEDNAEHEQRLIALAIVMRAVRVG